MDRFLLRAKSAFLAPMWMMQWAELRLEQQSRAMPGQLPDAMKPNNSTLAAGKIFLMFPGVDELAGWLFEQMGTQYGSGFPYGKRILRIATCEKVKTVAEVAKLECIIARP